MKRLLLVSLFCLLLWPLTAGATVAAYSKDGPFVGSGVVGQTFTITLDFFDTSDLIVTTRVTATGAEATLTETTDYTISGTGSSPYTGGTVTLVGSLAATSTLTISRSTPQTQTTDLVTGDTLPAETLEDRYDKLTMQIQDLQEQINRSLRVPITDGSTVEAACALDDAVSRASSYLTFDANGLPSVTATTITDTTASAFAATLLDDANAGAALTTLGISAFAQTVLNDTTAAAARTTLGVPDSVVVLDEDDMGANAGSTTEAPSQDSVYDFVAAGTLTMTGKTLTTPTLTSPVLNTGVSGTAVLDEDAMGSDSNTKLATQQSIKAYVDNNISVFSPTVAAGMAAGTVSCTLPNGMIMKWGSATLTNSTWADTTVTFATAFTNGCYNIQITPAKTNDTSGDYAPYAHTLSAASFKIRSRVGTRLTPVFWFAVGY